MSCVFLWRRQAFDLRRNTPPHNAPPPHTHTYLPPLKNKHTNADKQVTDARMDALQARQESVDAAVAQLTAFVLPIRTWIKLEETKGLDMSVRDGAPKSAAVRASRRFFLFCWVSSCGLWFVVVCVCFFWGGGMF